MTIDILNVPTMTSLEIADFVSKEHKTLRHQHVLRDIREMLLALYGKGGLSNFGQSYRNKQGKEQPMFRLPKRECLILVAKYSLKVRAAIIDRWLELEDPAVTGLAPMEMLTQLQSQVELAVEERDVALQAYAELEDSYEAEQAINQEVEDELASTKQDLEHFQESEAELSQAVQYLQPNQYMDAIQNADAFLLAENTHLLEDAHLEINKGSHLCMVANKALQVYRETDPKALPPNVDLRHIAYIEISVSASVAHSIANVFFTENGIDMCEPGTTHFCKPEVIEFGLYYTAYALQNDEEKVTKLFDDFQAKTGLPKETIAHLAVAMVSCLPIGYFMPELPAGRVIVRQLGRVYWKVFVASRIDMN